MSVLTSVTNFFKLIFNHLIKTHGAELLDFAIGQAAGFASALMDSNIPGSQKLDTVKSQLQGALLTKGVELAEHELNLIVEIAVKFLKSKAAPSSAAPVDNTDKS